MAPAARRGGGGPRCGSPCPAWRSPETGAEALPRELSHAARSRRILSTLCRSDPATLLGTRRSEPAVRRTKIAVRMLIVSGGVVLTCTSPAMAISGQSQTGSPAVAQYVTNPPPATAPAPSTTTPPATAPPVTAVPNPPGKVEVSPTQSSGTPSTPPVEAKRPAQAGGTPTTVEQGTTQGALPFTGADLAPVL